MESSKGAALGAEGSELSNLLVGGEDGGSFAGMSRYDQARIRKGGWACHDVLEDVAMRGVVEGEWVCFGDCCRFLDAVSLHLRK